MSGKRDGFDIVCFISLDWDRYQRRPHLTALSECARILCVELPFTPLTPLQQRRKRRRLPPMSKRLRQVGTSLYVYTPFALVPYGLSFRSALLSHVNSHIIKADLRTVLGGLGMKAVDVAFVFAPQQECVLDVLRPSLWCYEIVDEWATGPFAPNLEPESPFASRILSAERKILARADIVFATSQRLAERKGKYNRNTYFVPNAADVEHFEQALTDIPAPDDMKGIHSPVIGYVGYVNHILDMDIIDRMSATHPQWSIVMVGPVSEDKAFLKSPAYQRVRSRANVHFLGWRDYDVLPGYIKPMDVCIIPRRICDYSMNSHPNKLYQYLAAGKPVVSTAFPAARMLSSVIRVADSPAIFCQLVAEELEQNDTQAASRRLQVARANSTRVRAQQKIQIIREHLSRAAARESEM